MEKNAKYGPPPFGARFFLGLGPTLGAPTVTHTHTPRSEWIGQTWIGQNWFRPLAGRKPRCPKKLAQSRSLPTIHASCSRTPDHHNPDRNCRRFSRMDTRGWGWRTPFGNGYVLLRPILLRPILLSFYSGQVYLGQVRLRPILLSVLVLLLCCCSVVLLLCCVLLFCVVLLLCVVAKTLLNPQNPKPETETLNPKP